MWQSTLYFFVFRFGVILEAYLTSCGEAMLRQFEHQVEMQTTLEEIAMEVSMQTLLREREDMWRERMCGERVCVERGDVWRERCV